MSDASQIHCFFKLLLKGKVEECPKLFHYCKINKPRLCNITGQGFKNGPMSSEDYNYLSEVLDDTGNTAEVRPDFDLVLNCAIISHFLLMGLKLCKAKVDDSVQTVVGSLAYCTNYLTEVCGVQLYESGI